MNRTSRKPANAVSADASRIAARPSDSYEQALATLRRLDDNSKDHMATRIALLGRLYLSARRLGRNLAEILPRNEKTRSISSQETLSIAGQRARAPCRRICSRARRAAMPLSQILGQHRQGPAQERMSRCSKAWLRSALMRTNKHQKRRKRPDQGNPLKQDWRGQHWLSGCMAWSRAADPNKQLQAG